MATIDRSGISGGGTIQATHITNIIDALDGTSTTTTVVATGSFTGSLVGALTGTASFATTALSASYAANVPVTASYALAALSSSYAVTASYALNAGASSGGGFPYTGSAIISGSLTITGATNLTGSINVSQADANTLSGRITGGENLFIDLTEVGKSPAVGTFIIPNRQPDTPYPGSIYITAGRFYIYDGSNWREIQYV
jgi:hypothetical protein